ncbi:hypothetical protein TNCV_4645101 [Trichonephila clavipes]|nr:hypothetical protein TNCV_4645101 [Trichonephila clavipes]
MVEYSTFKFAASIQIAKLSSSSIAAKSIWSSKFDGRTLHGLSSTLVSPELKRENYYLLRLSMMYLSYLLAC